MQPYVEDVETGAVQPVRISVTREQDNTRIRIRTIKSEGQSIDLVLPTEMLTDTDDGK